MTPRKPANIDFPGWVEQQIRAAQADGAFENLPGKGQPIPGLGTPQHELAWVADYLRRENVDVVGVLPPALALAKEVEDLPTRLLREPSADAARRVVDDLNRRIAKAHAAPQIGPPFRVKLVDADTAVAQWRDARAELLRLQAEQRADTPVRVPDPPRKRWFRRG